TGPLSSADFYRITEGVLSALDYAHSKRLVHRDVKPSNILLDLGGNAYLGDFGLVLAFDQQRLTRTGTTMGPPQYMSPEQISDPATVDHRSDLYSLGCVMYEMLTGRPPFDDSVGGFEVKLAHVQQPPPPPRFWNPQIPVALEQVVLQCLAKEPAQRFSSCKELYKALWATPPVKPPEEPERRGFLGVALAGLAALTVAGGGGAWYWTRCCSAPPVEPRPVQKETEKADPKTTELERQPVIQRPVIQGEEGRKQQLLPPDRELPKTQETPKREEPREPVPKREIVPAPELPLSGSLTWSGPVSKNDRITITGSTASKGTVSGDPMPADRWLEVNLNNKNYGVAEAPTVSNENRITLRASKKGDGRVTINWRTVR
ncbi:MAG: protein kinase, partial [Acidobacteria bacterium]|nr:protein kinase [Acidobacteriota bacterium]